MNTPKSAMQKTYDVEWYIKERPDRIRIACQHKAQQFKLDFNLLEKECIAEARTLADEYDDKYGTSGFVKWFTIIVNDIATRMVNNPSAYRKKLAGEDISLPTPQTVTKPKPSKVCSMCEEDKVLEEFYNNKNTKDGKSSACKRCLDKKIKENKTRKSGINNVEKISNARTLATIEAKEQIALDPSIGFDNEELDFMIQQSQAKIAALDDQILKLVTQKDRLDLLIQKLQKRKK